MTTAELEALAREVEAFEGSEEEARALSDRVLLAKGWTEHNHTHRHLGEPKTYWKKPGQSWMVLFPPNPILSIDDANALLPEGWSIDQLYRPRSWHKGLWLAIVLRNEEPSTGLSATGYTEACARTAAALRAEAVERG